MIGPVRDDRVFEAWATETGARVANCAGCGLLVCRRAPSHLRHHRLEGRVKGRPYCGRCLELRGRGRGRRGR